MDIDINYKDFGFYNIDLTYLKHLHDIDGEVRYSEEKAYDRKPFLGIMVMINSYNYFIPLTSGKPKHSAWKVIGKDYFLIYETIRPEEQRNGDIVKSLGSKLLRVLAVLDVKKMIPVPDGLYKQIDFMQVQDQHYQGLLWKEFRSCRRIDKEILEKAEAAYREQKETGTIHPMFCNFAALEKACDDYRPEKLPSD